MGDEYKKFDSDDTFEICGVRLAKDAEVREGANGKMVRLTFVSTSKAESDSDLWVEANIADRQAELAAFLRKGDILHKLDGKPCMRRYGDSNEKFSFSLRRAGFVMPAGLWSQVKERGWTPGQKAATPPPKYGKKPTRSRLDDEDADIPF